MNCSHRLTATATTTTTRNRAMSRASARSGASSALRGSPQRSAAGAAASLNNLPSDRVLKAWKEMLVFLQVNIMLHCECMYDVRSVHPLALHVHNDVRGYVCVVCS